MGILLYLIIVMCINLIIELPITYFILKKYGDGKYIIKISILINCITNLIINLITVLYFVISNFGLYEKFLIIYLIEIFIVILPEALVYYKALNKLSLLKSMAFSFIFNTFSYGIGCLLVLFLVYVIRIV